MGAGHLEDESAFDLSLRLGASMNAKLAFTAISEMPLLGSRAAAMSW
jgi:hypothetical protein